ncbi:hypothetical protein [Desulfoluna butyratoxydans]|uniref:Lipoprotein n=1 Tax=Desulfoluna butyratoxydans TaxID=231438 RepID=A0A4V6ILJ1_9BACT|nr:hypothetical protein [Desulfoluna butyratoxydans]VFQ45298.1 hypothetical protein MSL71_29550 [Desulfoluna butyratoxydans]
MMKKTLLLLSVLFAFGCSSMDNKTVTTALTPDCLGDTEIPAAFKDQFKAAEDSVLLDLALGAPDKGKLCWGQVYVAKENSDVTIYRAWNSTNPHSKMGQWWSFSKPTGLVSAYRSGCEICYQWSPLDKLVVGRLKPGTKIVVGTGQSAKCSEYLTYPVSDEKQVFIKDADTSVETTSDYDLVFKWR